MKRLLRRPSTFIVIMAIGTLGLSILAAQQLALTKTDDGSKKIVISAAFAPLSLAAYPINRLKIDSRQPWGMYITQSHLRADREQVEVLARSITFPPVLKQGERMISVEYPNATILCLEAAYYAGQAQGLILAMDRDSVVEHKLLWTIDNAGDLFDSCLNIYLREAFDDAFSRYLPILIRNNGTSEENQIVRLEIDPEQNGRVPDRKEGLSSENQKNVPDVPDRKGESWEYIPR